MAQHRVASFRPIAGFLLGLFAALAVAAPAGAEESFEDLVANLKSPTARTRYDAVVALAKSRRREAVAPISALVRDPEPRVRRGVVDALRDLRDVSAVPALVTSLQDGDPRIREEAISALVEIYSERERGGPAEAFLQAFSDEFDRASVPPFTAVDPGAIQGLAGRLRDEEKAIRAEAAYAIGILDGRAAVPALTAALQDTESNVRGAAVSALGKVGSQADGRALIPLIADESTAVRRQAMQAIGVLRIREAGPALRELFEQNRKREMGIRVLASLSRIGDPAQADLFRELVASSDPEQRRLAVEGLGRIADRGMIDGFKKDFLREKNSEVRLAYSFAIVLLGDRAFVDSIVFAFAGKGPGAQRARGYVLEIGPSIGPDLYAYLNDTDPQVRGAVCDVLAQLGDVAAIDRLQALLGDGNSKVADRANRAIERLRRGATKATPAP
jgi:HEAT repeat protein